MRGKPDRAGGRREEIAHGGKWARIASGGDAAQRAVDGAYRRRRVSARDQHLCAAAATWDDFVRADAWPGFVRGPEMIEAVEGFNIPIAGAVKRLRRARPRDRAAGLVLGAARAPMSTATPTSGCGRCSTRTCAAQGPFDGDLSRPARRDGRRATRGRRGRVAAPHPRASSATRMPIVASLDYHANMTPEMVAAVASAMVGYRTYPHIDMAVTGNRAAELLDRLLKEQRPVYQGLSPDRFPDPAGLAVHLHRAGQEHLRSGRRDRGGGDEGAHNQGIVAVTHTPGFPPADIAQCGPALVVYGHDKEAVEAAADRLAAAVKAQEKAFAGELLRPRCRRSPRRSRCRKNAKKPIVLADVQDNPGAGGTSDTVGLLRALMRSKAKGAVIGMIVDRGRRQGGAVETGEGAMSCAAASAPVVGYAGETPVEADWRVVRLGSGKFHRHRPVLRRRQVPDRPDGAGHRRGERRLGRARLQAHPGGRPGDVPPCRRRAGTGADPRR